MAKFLKIFLFLIFITSYELRVTSYETFAQDKIIAIVNNDVITQKDLNDFLNFMRMQLAAQYKARELENKIQSIKLDLLDKLIEDHVILCEAKVNNIKIEEARVKARIEEIKKRYPSDAEFQAALTQQGLTQADIESKIRDQLLMYNIIDAKIKSKIIINPSEVTDFYEKNNAEFKTLEEREFEVIIIDKEDKAFEVYKDLSSGVDLKELALKFSLPVDKITASKGGELNKDIEDVIFKLGVAEVSRPINWQDTFYIFKLNNIIAPHQQSLSEVQDKIYEFLFERKMELALVKWLDELKAQSYIKILQD